MVNAVNDTENTSPWNKPPEGANIPDMNSFPARTPHHRLVMVQDNWQMEVNGKSHEIFLEKLNTWLEQNNFNSRTNGEDFLFFREKPGKPKKFTSIAEGTLVLTALLDENEKRLSELDRDAQNSLHNKEGGFTLQCDYVIKRNHVVYFTFIFFSLFMGFILGEFLAIESVLLTFFVIPMAYSALLLIVERKNVISKKDKIIRKSVYSALSFS